MNKCDHLIGTISGLTVYDNDGEDGLRQRLLNEQKMQEALCEFGWRQKRALTPLQIADARRGHLHRYQFCPYCGSKIEWRKLLQEIANNINHTRQ